MISIIINLIISSLVIFGIANVLPGVHVVDFQTAIIVAMVLGLLNALLKPVLLILTLPITIVTLGLFSFVLNAILILLVSNLISGFTVDGFLWALIFGVILSLVNTIVHNFLP